MKCLNGFITQLLAMTPTFSDPCARKRVTVVAMDASSFVKVVIIPSATTESDEERAKGTKKPMNACGTRAAIAKRNFNN